MRAVDAGEVARRVLSTHFMRDLTGNLKAFASQRFRCTKCNAKFRRVPLKGTCTRCGGKLSLTVYKGGVEKYLQVAQDLVNTYNLGQYHTQRLILLREEISSLFNQSEEKKKQPSLTQFVWNGCLKQPPCTQKRIWPPRGTLKQVYSPEQKFSSLSKQVTNPHRKLRSKPHCHMNV